MRLQYVSYGPNENLNLKRTTMVSSIRCKLCSSRCNVLLLHKKPMKAYCCMCTFMKRATQSTALDGGANVHTQSSGNVHYNNTYMRFTCVLLLLRVPRPLAQARASSNPIRATALYIIATLYNVLGAHLCMPLAYSDRDAIGRLGDEYGLDLHRSNRVLTLQPCALPGHSELVVLVQMNDRKSRLLQCELVPQARPWPSSEGNVRPHVVS